MSLSEGRKEIFRIAEKVQVPSTYYTLTENGRPRVVILSAEEFESWIETAEVMKDFPHLSSDVAQLKMDIKSGVYKKYTSLQEVLKREGLVPPTKHGVPSTSQKASRKRTQKHSGKRS